MYKLINKTIVIFIIVIMFIVTQMQLVTVNAVNTLDKTIKETDNYIEKFMQYEMDHMRKHRNADLQQKYTNYMLYGYTLINFIIVVFFLLIAKKNKSRKIINIYILLLMITTLIYFIGIKFIMYSYPSDLAIINTNLYMVIFLSFISFLFGTFAEGNRAKIIFSTIPIMAFSVIFLIYEFYSFEYLLNDLSTLLNYVINIELCTQILLIPSYIKDKR